MNKDPSQTPEDERPIHPIGRSLLWIEEPDNIGRMIGFLAVICVFLVVGDFVFNRYGYFDFEETYGFYAVFGFLSFALIIFAVKVLQFFVERREDYYAPNSVDAEDYPEEGLDVKEYGHD